MAPSTTQVGALANQMSHTRLPLLTCGRPAILQCRPQVSVPLGTDGPRCKGKKEKNP